MTAETKSQENKVIAMKRNMTLPQHLQLMYLNLNYLDFFCLLLDLALSLFTTCIDTEHTFILSCWLVVLFLYCLLLVNLISCISIFSVASCSEHVCTNRAWN